MYMSVEAKNVRKRILDMAYYSGVSTHLGGALSIVDILTVLYRDVLNYDFSNPTWEKRDRFILSKGHCVMSLFAIFVENGLISEDEIQSYMKDGSLFSSHPIMNLAHGIECSSGSLGQGISLALGIAKAAKLKKEDFKVYTLVGNGECNEGSVWETFMLAGQWKLDNFTIIIDNNGLQSDGDSANIIDLSNLTTKLSGFGFEIIEVDGHNEDELRKAYTADFNGKSKIIIANTIKGKGISFMENNNEWHHNRLIKEKYDCALSEL